MIDYYLNKKCPLVRPVGRQLENNRCNGCVWLDKKIEPHKCVFSLEYPEQVSMIDFEQCLMAVDEKQQAKLSNPGRRFVL